MVPGPCLSDNEVENGRISLHLKDVFYTLVLEANVEAQDTIYEWVVPWESERARGGSVQAERGTLQK